MNEEERHDPVAAALHARTNPRYKSNLPHYVRCDWMRGKERCLKDDGHTGEHKYPDNGSEKP